MSLLLQNEFIKTVNATASVLGVPGLPARKIYDIGMKYGITNSEVYTHFLGKHRAVARGKYLPFFPVPGVPNPSEAKNKAKPEAASDTVTQSKSKAEVGTDALSAAIATINSAL